jgi:hypothetical protein
MSFNTTIDDVVYQQTTQPQNIAEKNFVKKEWSTPIFDTNPTANYASSQIVFDTTILSNNGLMNNYAEGIIALPFVLRVSRSGGGGDNDWTDPSFSNTDFILGFKNSHVQLIDSVGITINNQDILQGVQNTNAYLTFIQHTEMSSDEEFLNSDLTGYCKDSSSSWYYNTPTKADGSALAAGDTTLRGDSRGVGLGNNCNWGLVNAFDTNETYNDGFLKRQKLINKINSEKAQVLGNVNSADIKATAKHYIENTTNGKYIYYDVYLKLADICPYFFRNLPMAVGLKMKITLRLNNVVSFNFQKNADGDFVYDLNSPFVNTTSNTNPLMIASSYNKIRSQTGGRWESTAADANVDGGANSTGNFYFHKTDVAFNNALVPCGSSCLPVSDVLTYTVQMRLGQIVADGVAKTHPRQQCVLYVPSYKMTPKYELEYFSESSRIRKIHYMDLQYNSFVCESGGNFDKELTSSCQRPKRLIMIPIITKEGNFGLDPMSSPFTTEPATCSPNIITNFNCALNNVNLFPNNITYSFDHYLQNMNGQYGVNANMVRGLVSSRINMTDYQNIYGYICVDLSRRVPEMDLVNQSVRVRGRVASSKPLNFLCFIEVEKILELDVMTGTYITRT